MIMLKNWIGGGILFCLCFGCQEKKNDTDLKKQQMVNWKIQLLNADKAFSDYCEQNRTKNAFVEWMDDNGTLLRPNNLPIVGAHAIDYLIQINDTAYTLKWQPHNAEVSESGDMGYTYGIYAITPSLMDTQLLGTYVTVWKRQEDGSWKFVVNSTNEGVGDPQY